MEYTVLPQGVHFVWQEPPADRMVIDGRMAVGCRQDGKFILTRLYSTDPRDYLDPRYSPGRVYPSGK